MSELDDEALERLADVVRLQPTKNAQLRDQWGLDDGSAVHRYLEDELGDYYYRDEDSYIRATPEAAELVDVDPGVEADGDTTVVRVSGLEAAVLDVLAGPDERSQSVVSVLHDLRDAGHDGDVDAVRSALRSLQRTGAAEVERRAVPTFRRSDADVEVRTDDE